MKPIKLKALDQEDLTVIAALVQDAITKPEALTYDGQAKTFSLVLNRFAWDVALGLSGRAQKAGQSKDNHQRRQAVLSFAQVSRVKSRGIEQGDSEQVLSLLAVNFVAGDAPSGEIELVFADGPVVRLDVECIEVQLADLGGAWSTRFKPRHPLS